MDWLLDSEVYFDKKLVKECVMDPRECKLLILSHTHTRVLAGGSWTVGLSDSSLLALMVHYKQGDHKSRAADIALLDFWLPQNARRITQNTGSQNRLNSTPAIPSTLQLILIQHAAT